MIKVNGQLIDPAEAGVIYVSDSGSDTTGTIEDPTRPVKTINKALQILKSIDKIIRIKILDTVTQTISETFPVKPFSIESNIACNINVQTTGNLVDLSGTTNAITIIDIPNGSINFQPSSICEYGTSDSNKRHDLTLRCYNLSSNANFSFSNMNKIRIDILNNFTLNGTLIGTVYDYGDIKFNKCSSTASAKIVDGGTSTAIIKLDFNSITTTNSFVIVSNTSSPSFYINHGNFTTTYLTPFIYLNAQFASVIFKPGTLVSGKVRWGHNGNMNYSGDVKYTGLDTCLIGDALGGNIKFNNLKIIIDSNFINGRHVGLIVDSTNTYFEFNGELTSGLILESDDVAPTSNPWFRFNGNNSINNTAGNGAKIFSSSYGLSYLPFIEINGELNTNGTVDPLISVRKYLKSNQNITIKDINSLPYTLVRDDENQFLNFDVITDGTFSIPLNSTIPFPVGTRLDFSQSGTGSIVLNPVDPSVVINSAIGLTTLKNGEYTLTKLGTNTWSFSGVQQISGTLANNTYFINNSTGNNSTGVYQDPSKPYATIDYVTALPDFHDGCTIYLQNSGTYYINNSIPEMLYLNIESPYDVVLDVSMVDTLCPYTGEIGNIVKHLSIDIPNGELFCDKNASGSFIYTDDNYRSIYINADKIYLNTDSILLSCLRFDINVNKLSLASAFIMNSINDDSLIKKISVIQELVCLTNGVYIFVDGGGTPYMDDIVIYKISGPGRFNWSSGSYNIGNISSTNVSLIDGSFNDKISIKFNNSIITSADGIELNNNALCIISGIIQSCPKINIIGSGDVNSSTEFKNFVANLGIGSIGSDSGKLVFENCSISSSGSPINATADGGGQIYIRNSSFLMDTPGYLISGGSGFSNKTAYILGIKTNANQIAEYDGIGINVVYQESAVQKYKTVSSSQNVDDSFDGCIVKVKSSATLTLDSNLKEGLNFVVTTFTGVTASFANAIGVTISSPYGFTLMENRMCTVFQDGLNNYVFRGELVI